ncbi:Cd2+/Zn2+-exporting ATPase [Ereboglobus sp. PH5-10]|uniref:P-type Zn(2+) transporter n=1 Tax=Ereboglobus luteus TaxID=1796921 RepID=A0A2U8E415_9BACT|nr:MULTISPECIES: heavy metal translocating P-type ATPase [Ereboglobus]AWI09649.1 cadmium-translocating P-type ATPase [Ereboglobus luteus]MDF9828076.1 Cd2+/Zn2+-exporting ATPase [Ereboglobus sp. PH5-10]
MPQSHSTHDSSSQHTDAGTLNHEEKSNRLETASLLISGVLVAISLANLWGNVLPEIAKEIFAFTAILAGGWFLLPKAWNAVCRLRPDINLLVVIAAIGASIIGEWLEASAVVFLFGVAEWLEGWADRRAKRATEALLELAPKTTLARRDGVFVEIPVEQVTAGEVIAVKSGMGIPLDGEIITGESAVNQAPITGESVPVDKKLGDPVFAGTINGEGSLEIKVTKPAADTTLARIIRLVAEAQEQKAPTQRFVDTFAKYYTPAVTLAALLIFLMPPLLMGGGWSVWLYRACVLLIIACPCALVISTPVGIVAGLTALARRGVLVKGGEHLETIAKLRALAVDKTGTITEGKPRVLSIECITAKSETEVLYIAAGIDDHSPHPIAKAIVTYAKEHAVAFTRAANYQSHSGRGAEGYIDTHPYFVGNHRFAHELGLCTSSLEVTLRNYEAKGQSVVIVGHRPNDTCAGKILGVIAVGDSLRPNARTAVANLRAAGIEHIVMLSGDNQHAADYVAKEAGIDEARGDLLPDDKVCAIKILRDAYESVGMVGDGVNDAPAMATANIGIAMGAAGTDAAIETSDITLMQDDLGKIAETIRIGRRTLSIVYFNIAFALSLKALFLILTVLGYANLWLAVLADTGATLLVVANSLRLLKVSTK